ncbi:hypothetical protein [Paenibacillus ehimensis]|uniref:GLUG domain-containing protein n=1 Tax=Paenibacillus ehimensis TaxID=79264 RepID=A0ABT8V5P6_9BACL|nr:hypothetical protein [Paenibacillus ehimensis]MDO3675602.1 hypothetical protein [Paenibacillus ehimensis]
MCYKSGIAFWEYVGDSDLEGNFINTNNVDYSGNDLLVGCGVIVGKYCNNLNIHGEKIEWNAKGIVIYGATGTIIQGINFDENKWVSVVIVGLTNGPTAAMGWTITGCRFLGGGTFSSTDNIGKSHISVLTTSSEATASGTITGNTLKKAGSGAYDNDTTGEIGPGIYGISFQGDVKDEDSRDWQ